jgi:serine/threonine protein kinase
MPDNPDRITLVREMSRSSIATVWEGFDAQLNRKVLVKTIHPQYARESDLRARFEREAMAIARLSHPNVVQIYDLRSEGDELSLRLEFVEGTSLRQVLKERGSLPPDVAVTIAEEILAGLEHAHAAGIVHRDLKPENVLVSKRGEVKITDFGLAMLRDMPSVTQQGMVVGTPAYMAPEQAEGGEVGAAADIFALGLMLFEMLTGRRVIEGNTLTETFQNVLKYQPPHLEELEQEGAAAVIPVLRRMLERQPAKRFATAAEARAALLQSQQAGFLPRTLIADYLSGEPMRRATTKSVAQRRAWTRPLSVIAIAILIVVAAVVVYNVARLMTHREAVKSEAADTMRAVSVPVTTPAKDSAVVPRSDNIPPPEETAAQEKPREIVENKGTTKLVEMPAVTGPGFVDVVCQPWARVYLGDSLIGTTPLPSPLKLAAGHHDLIFLNPEIGQPVQQPVTVTAGQTTVLRVDLFAHVARIRIASVKPWADVYVDGKLEMRTPSTKIIFRPLGTHTITLKHPDYPVRTDTIAFREGDPVHEIRTDLTHK